MATISETFSTLLAKQYNTKLLAGYTLVVAALLVIFLLTVLMHPDSASGSYMAVLSFCVIGILVSAIKVCSGSKCWVYTPSGSKVKSYSLFFKNEDYDKLEKGLAANNINVLYNLSSGGNSGLRVDVVVSEDALFAACQIFKYVPYNYEPASEVFQVADSNIALLKECIKKHV